MQHHLTRLMETRPANPDWLLWTDGSGHHGDKLEVSCAWFCSGRAPHYLGSVLSASTCGSVNRAELKALLDGLHGILEEERRRSGRGASWVPPFPRLILWSSDRQNLVLGVARDPLDGKPLNSRDTDPDLWARFAFYEAIFRIHPTLVPRNAVAWQAHCDKACSATRLVLKKWAKHLRRKLLLR